MRLFPLLSILWAHYRNGSVQITDCLCIQLHCLSVTDETHAVKELLNPPSFPPINLKHYWICQSKLWIRIRNSRFCTIPSPIIRDIPACSSLTCDTIFQPGIQNFCALGEQSHGVREEKKKIWKKLPVLGRKRLGIFLWYLSLFNILSYKII